MTESKRTRTKYTGDKIVRGFLLNKDDFLKILKESDELKKSSLKTAIRMLEEEGAAVQAAELGEFMAEAFPPGRNGARAIEIGSTREVTVQKAGKGGTSTWVRIPTTAYDLNPGDKVSVTYAKDGIEVSAVE